MGELAAVAGTQLRADVPEILPLVIDAIQDGGSPAKRLVAVSTLGQVVESTGCVVSPYLEYPQLLGVLLRMLSEGGAGVRREVMKVLGIVGALDPHTHKLNLAELQGEGRLEREGVRPQLPSRDAPDPGEGGQPLRPQRCACACRAGLPVSRTPRLGCWLSPQLPPGPTSPTGRCRGCGRRG
jgi:FKBP12-rapamycin complex-associated protein